MQYVFGYKYSAVRQAFIEAYQGLCQYCGEHSSEYHIDHIQPRAGRGQNTLSNYTLACKECNIKKQDFWPEKSKRRSLIESALKKAPEIIKSLGPWHHLEETKINNVRILHPHKINEKALKIYCLMLSHPRLQQQGFSHYGQLAFYPMRVWHLPAQRIPLNRYSKITPYEFYKAMCWLSRVFIAIDSQKDASKEEFWVHQWENNARGLIRSWLCQEHVLPISGSVYILSDEMKTALASFTPTISRFLKPNRGSLTLRSS